MHGLIDYMKRNAMFVVILAAIILVTLGLIIYELLLSVPAAQSSESSQESTSQMTQATESDTAIVGFTGRLSNDDVVILSWQIDNGQQTIISSALYYVDEKKGDIWLADVTNHSSYQLSQDAYQFAGGENTFKIVCTLDNDDTIEAQTTVNIIQIDHVKFSREIVNEGIRLYLSYTSTSGSLIDVPILSFYGNGAEQFSVHYLDTQRSEENGQVQTTVSYLLQDNGVRPGSYRFTLTFRFLQLNQSYEYSVDYEKKDAQEQQTQSNDTTQEANDEQSTEENNG